MNFDLLPDIAFLRIFDYLSFTDRFRVGRVSQSFNKNSQIVNAHIKSLDLNDPMFCMLNADQFEVILRHCQHNLQDVKFRYVNGTILASKFSEFVCPQLINLNLHCATITDDEFARIVTNHSNLKSLKWNSANKSDDAPTLPPVALPHLETLHIQGMNDVTLERFIDRCPNLKTLRMTMERASSEDVWDRFFRSVPHLESLELDVFECPMLMENLEWFWRLPLTSFTIRYQNPIDEFMINDDFVYKLVENFTDIEHLDLGSIETSEDAVAALSRLEKLRKVRLDVTDLVISDDEIREFSACRHLEELNVWPTALSGQTWLNLFDNCPRLLKLSGIREVFDDQGGLIDAETAGMLIMELANMAHRQSITIEFSPFDDEKDEMKLAWESIQVQNAVQDLKQNHGIEVNICFD